MRIYGTQRIAAYIRQKNDVMLKYGKPTRPLTADDFEIVPEHDEEVLSEVRCDLCGMMADWFTTEGDAEYTSLIELGFRKASRERGYEDITEDFFGVEGYEVCEPCLKTTIIPALLHLRPNGPHAVPHAEPEEEPALVPESEARLRRLSLAPRALIGEDDEQSNPPQVPPLSDDEPF